MNENFEQFTAQEQQVLTEIGFYNDQELRQLVLEIKREHCIDPREVFQALRFAFQNGLNLQKYLQGLRERVMA
nr:hypothetical protein [uncultured Desulfobulbus sp.]